VLANSPLAGWFAGIWTTPVSLSLGTWTVSGDLGHLIINDGLMVMFFFIVGLEVKREIVHGELHDPRKALLPVFAALGGVVMPAAIYLALQWGQPGQHGWAIPMATDIAFLQSGVHPTVAGVLLGLMTPAGAWVARQPLADALQTAWRHASDSEGAAHVTRTVAGHTQVVAREAVSPLHRLEEGLHPWVAFGVMPLFALANAGVVLQLSSLGEPVAIAVASGLGLGKPVGIMLLCLLAVRLRITQLPEGVTWPMLTGGACLAGVGFTMALFLNGLAFPAGEVAGLEAAGKVGTLAGSAVSAVLGAVVLTAAVRR